MPAAGVRGRRASRAALSGAPLRCRRRSRGSGSGVHPTCLPASGGAHATAHVMGGEAPTKGALPSAPTRSSNMEGMRWGGAERRRRRPSVSRLYCDLFCGVCVRRGGHRAAAAAARPHACGRMRIQEQRQSKPSEVRAPYLSRGCKAALYLYAVASATGCERGARDALTAHTHGAG